jgi:hypothetical protein
MGGFYGEIGMNEVPNKAVSAAVSTRIVCEEAHHIPAGFCEAWWPCGCSWKGQPMSNDGTMREWLIAKRPTISG